MKDAVIILCGGGPAPGMNSVSMSVAKTFLSKGYRVIGLHGGYSGLFSKNARTEDLDFFIADRFWNRGGSYLEMSRFKPTDKDFEENFNLRLVAIERPETKKNLLVLPQTIQQVIHPTPGLPIQAGDTLLLFGRIESIDRLGKL